MDVNICICQLPCQVKGFCKANYDGSYTVVLNAILDRETQRQVFMHELRHVLGGDFESDRTVSEKELDLALAFA